MNAERSQLYYTCIFLHVSFQAILRAVDDGERGESTPCWLDAQLIGMLSRELQRCHRDAAPLSAVAEALGTATYHCGLLMAQCPAALNRRLCQHHLRAIMAPLEEASARLARPTPRPATGRQTAARRLRDWLRG